jgi:hypothetical protein
MKVAQKIGILVLALAVLPLSGCFFKKKKPPVPPPQAQAPTITVPITPGQLPPEQPPATPPPATAPPKPAATKAKTRHRAPKKSGASTPPPAPAPATTAKSNANTVPEGGANEASVQISAEVPRDAAAQQRQDTNQLLESTEANLRKIGTRNFSENDKAAMRQIRNYITQSRLAMQDGDLERAYNLATKANLLSNEFVKRL